MPNKTCRRELTDTERNQIIGAKIGFDIVHETMTNLDMSDKTQRMLKVAMSEKAIGGRLGHSKNTVHTILRRHKETAATTVGKRSGRPPKLLGMRIIQLNALMQLYGKNKMSVDELHEEFMAFTGVYICRETFISYL